MFFKGAKIEAAPFTVASCIGLSWLLYVHLLARSVAHAAGAGQALVTEATKVTEFTNSSGKNLRNWPVAVTIPVPPSLGSSTASLQLKHPGRQQPLPTSVRALTPRKEKVPQWYRVYAQMDLEPGKKIELGIHGAPHALSNAGAVNGPVSVRHRGERVDVQNDAIFFSIRQHSEFWVDTLARHDSRARGIRIRGEAEVDGVQVVAGPVESIEVLDTGPLRALIEIRGRYGKSPLLYRLRIECFAKQPVLRVFHTFEIHADTPAIRLGHVTVELQFPRMHGARALYRLDGVARPLEGRLPLMVVQNDNEAYTIAAERRQGRLTGWFDLHDGGLGLTLWARWFWQQYPQAVEMQAQKLRYQLYGGTDRPALAGTGAAKTHEFVLALRHAGAPPEVEELSQVPLEGRVDPQWLVATGALPAANVIGTNAGAAFLRRVADAWERVQKTYDREEWDDRQEAHCREPGQPDPAELRRRGFYGMWNWGDWNYPGYHDTTKGCDAWGNLEYDLTQVLALAYWLTGNARFHEPMLAAGRHFMDVDIIHYQSAYPQWIGMNHPKNPLHWSFELGGVDLGHTWTEGLLSLYLLSGDDVALAAARGIGEYLLRRARSPLNGNPRQFGWPQIALVALYEVTNDHRYLDGAREYARWGMERHRPDKVHDWKLGILAEGLSYTHRHTEEPTIRKWLKEYAVAVAAVSANTDARLWPAVAYMASLEGDRELAQRAKAVSERLDFGGWAKPFTIAGRVGFAILSNLGPLADGPSAANQKLPSGSGNQLPPDTESPP